jgi:DNA polymerase-3 subunit epsilon
MKLLIVDTETTGLDPTCDRVIEVAAILYSVPYRTSLFQLSTLLNTPNNPAEPINHIPPSVLLEVCTQTQQTFITLLQCLAADASYVVAHNAPFDRQWFNDKHLPTLTSAAGVPLPWLCTMDDFVFPKQNRPGESLITLALNHGIGVSSAHRALTDCTLIAALFDRIPNLEVLIEQAKRSKALFKAEVSYDDRQLAKDAGFKWDGTGKRWIRRMAQEDTVHLGFPVTQISEVSSPVGHTSTPAKGT